MWCHAEGRQRKPQLQQVNNRSVFMHAQQRHTQAVSQNTCQASDECIVSTSRQGCLGFEGLQSSRPVCWVKAAHQLTEHKVVQICQQSLAAVLVKGCNLGLDQDAM